MERVITGGTALGGTAPGPDSASDSKVLDEDSRRTYLDITNLDDSEYIYVSFNEEPDIQSGIAIGPGDYRQLFDPPGSVYIVSESGNVSYSLFAGRG